MVWSEQIGASIILPSDRVDGDGRNYIVIGTDVPSEIASAFTAALVFYNGRWDGLPANQYPNGFKYWALGITNNGSLEIVAYYFVVSFPDNNLGSFQFYRQTVLSISPPIGNGQPPVIALGGGAFSTYNEGTTGIYLSNQNYTGQPAWQNLILTSGYVSWDTGGWLCVWRMSSDGTVFIEGLAKYVGAGIGVGAASVIATGLPQSAHNAERTCHVFSAAGSVVSVGQLTVNGGGTSLTFGNTTGAGIATGMAISIGMSYSSKQ